MSTVSRLNRRTKRKPKQAGKAPDAPVRAHEDAGVVDKGRDGQMKFCKDCKHFRPEGTPLGFYSPDLCLHNAAKISPEPVYGIAERMPPKMMRGEDGPCGPDAKLFEEIPPPPPPVRYCEDCRWMIPDTGLSGEKRIQSAMCGKTSRVGRAIGENFCSTMRRYDDSCGKDAKWFEPRPPGSVLFTESPPAPWWKFW